MEADSFEKVEDRFFILGKRGRSQNFLLLIKSVKNAGKFVLDSLGLISQRLQAFLGISGGDERREQKIQDKQDAGDQDTQQEAVKKSFFPQFSVSLFHIFSALISAIFQELLNL
jgi:hypothetical protein